MVFRTDFSSFSAAHTLIVSLTEKHTSGVSTILPCRQFVLNRSNLKSNLHWKICCQDSCTSALCRTHCQVLSYWMVQCMASTCYPTSIRLISASLVWLCVWVTSGEDYLLSLSSHTFSMLHCTSLMPSLMVKLLESSSRCTSSSNSSSILALRTI